VLQQVNIRNLIRVPQQRSQDKMDNISSMGNFGIDNKVANLVRCYNKRDRLMLVAVLRSG